MPLDWTSKISLTVSNRHNINGRVYYKSRNDNDHEHPLVPEQVVLSRWRKTHSDKYSFHGSRLSPTLWKGLVNVDFMSHEWSETCQPCRSQDCVLADEDASFFRLPNHSVLRAMHKTIGGVSMAAITQFQTVMIKQQRYGTPDLFLWMQNKQTGRPTFGAFVEVKKPDEPLSRDQKFMLWKLKRLGLNAKVIRLKETPSRSSQCKCGDRCS